MPWKIKYSEDGHAVALVEVAVTGAETNYFRADNDFENKVKASQLVFSDVAVTPVQTDPDIERVKEILAKRDSDVTPAELKEAVLKFLRKRV